jgi:hypothetical protein
MSTIILSPVWFFNYDVGFELFFAIISLVIGIFALKINRIVSINQAKLFGISFILISVSYLLETIFNFLVVSSLNQYVCTTINCSSATMLDYYGLYLHLFFMMTGLILLLYMTFRSNNAKIFWAIEAVSLFGVLLSANPIIAFYLISSICLTFITWYYINNYLNNRQTKTLLIAGAFICILFGTIHFFLSVNHQLFYVIAHFLEMIAYILILLNFYLVLKR